MTDRSPFRGSGAAALLALLACSLASGGCSSGPAASTAPAPPPPTAAPPPAAAPAPAVVYRTFNYPQRWNTTGALLFESREAVKACFARVYSGRGQGFRPCEATALAVVPPDLRLRILETWDSEAIAKVELLEGERKGLVAYIHELWISPSPWERTP